MTDTPHDLGGEPDIITGSETDPPPDAAAIRRFALPSLLGVATFLTPVKVDGNWTILMGLISDTGRDAVGAGMPWVVFALLCISAVGTLYAKTLGRGSIDNDSLFARLFNVAPIWVGLRIIGLIMGTMTMFQIGPEIFWQAFFMK